MLGYKPWRYSGTDAEMSVVPGGGLMCTSATHASCKKVLSFRVFVFLILVSVWSVNSYCKALFVLKVTFTLICLNNFVTCLTCGFTCETYIFIVPYFPTYYSTGMHVRFYIYVFLSLSELFTGKCAYG
jgi:hypothetical protein